jgi:hypothetical protein
MKFQIVFGLMVNAAANSFTLYIRGFSITYPCQLWRLSHRAVSKATRKGRLYGTVPVTFSRVGMQREHATADFKRGLAKVARNLPEIKNGTLKCGCQISRKLLILNLVGAEGFEPPTLCSQSEKKTCLSMSLNCFNRRRITGFCSSNSDP